MDADKNRFEIQGDGAIDTLCGILDKLHYCKEFEIESLFYEIAEYLMKYVTIFGKGKNYFITELEFYYCREDHEDCHCHAYNEYKNRKNHPQKFGLCWYFHGSGMDITIGNGKDIYGGVLIRSVCDVDGNNTCGPLKSRELILGLEDKENVIDNCYGDFISIKTTDENNLSPYFNKAIRILPRHGLNPKKENFDQHVNENQFYCRPYRFLIDVPCKK